MLAFLDRTRRIAGAGAWTTEVNDLYARNFGVRDALNVLRGGSLSRGGAGSEDTRIVAYATFHCLVTPGEHEDSH